MFSNPQKSFLIMQSINWKEKEEMKQNGEKLIWYTKLTSCKNVQLENIFAFI